MYELDKSKFGPFIAMLRKEKGLTQKELAEKLYISDKAVSKWETCVSIPDTSLLIPLAEILGVNVSELLMCQRIESDDVVDSAQLENIVKAAVSYPDKNPRRAYHESRKWILNYIISVLLGCIGLMFFVKTGAQITNLLTLVSLSAVFGLYFCCFVKTKLPDFYNSNRIGFYSDGPVRMNIPGVAFSDSNWPYIVRAIRIWACLFVSLFPYIAILLNFVLPEFWTNYELYIIMFCMFGGLLLPVYIVGKKYE